MAGSDGTLVISRAEALPDRQVPIPVPPRHYVNGNALQPPFPPGMEQAVFGLGCFWGAERLFWRLPGVWSTAVGYAGGHTAHPSYRDVCSGMTGHAEVALVVYDPAMVGYGDLLKVFWEAHDPTQGMRQGNDLGTQYRSALYTITPEQAALARASQAGYQRALKQAGRGAITTEIAPLGTFYHAEEYHQQYLAKEPQGYCGLKGTGVPCLP